MEAHEPDSSAFTSGSFLTYYDSLNLVFWAHSLGKLLLGQGDIWEKFFILTLCSFSTMRHICLDLYLLWLLGLLYIWAHLVSQNNTPISEKSLIALSEDGGIYRYLMVVPVFLQPLPNDGRLSARTGLTLKQKKLEMPNATSLKHSKIHVHAVKVLRKQLICYAA